MRDNGFTVNHKVVERLMREQGLRCLVRARKYRSYKGHVGKVADNIVGRRFNAGRPLARCATDISQVSIGGQKLYISAIIDMWNGEVLACRTSENPDTRLVLDMMEDFYGGRTDFAGAVTVHSDQGCQYQSSAFVESLRSHNIVQSMSRKGNCYDNAMMENFFGLMKSEVLYNAKYRTVGEFDSALKEYIRYYNNDRIKLRLGTSPVKYRHAHLHRRRRPAAK